MKVLYVSKALCMAAYRDKLRSLSEHVDIVGVVPETWGDQPIEEGDDSVPDVISWPVRFAGHNHFHLYRRPDGLVRDMTPDLVHIDEEPFSAVTFQLTRVCRSQGIPSLFCAWQNLDKALPPPFAAMRSYVFRHSGAAIAGTRRAADVLRRAGYTGDPSVIPQFGVNTQCFAPNDAVRTEIRDRFSFGDSDLVVGFGGRLVPEKGLDLLISAAVKHPHLRLVILGDGPQRASLEGTAQKAGIADRIHFVGQVPSLEVPRWLPALDVLALPSLTTKTWTEQFGRILVEAMACGVPVVASNAGEIPRVVGDAGIIVPEGDATALGAALDRLAKEPSARATLAERARTRAVTRFSQESVATATVKVYGQVLGGANS